MRAVDRNRDKRRKKLEQEKAKRRARRKAEGRHWRAMMIRGLL